MSEQPPNISLGKLIPPEIKGDPFAAAITELARTQNLKHILEIGASSGEGSTEAWMAGIRQNPARPILHCIEISRARFDALRQRWAGESQLKAYNVSSIPHNRWPSEQQISDFYQNTPTRLNNWPLETVIQWYRDDVTATELWKIPENGIEQIRRENDIPRFDAVLIDGSEFTGPMELDAVYGARFILLDDVDSLKNYANYRRLVADPRYVLIRCDFRVRSGFAIFQLSDGSEPAWPVRDPLPVHFFTIVLNGEPFIRHHIEQMRQLPFEWHWHVVEGVAALRHDTAWSVASGGNIPIDQQRSGLSIDGTTEYLTDMAAREDGRVLIYRKNPNEMWDGKREMVSAPFSLIDSECLLWEIDADELWTAQQFITGRKLFLDQPAKTAAFFWCHYFVGPSRVISTRGGYANNPAGEWLRAWRYRPGMFWLSHEPPTLCQRISPTQARDVARVNPLLHADTEAAGLVFQHFAYATEAQVIFKEIYYGYRGAARRWKALQAEKHLPALLRNYFPWVQDETRVGRAADFVAQPLLSLPEPDLTEWWNGNPEEIPRPRIAIDSIFYQFYSTGIGRVWSELLQEWVANGFVKHLILLDRLGGAPILAGVRRVLIPPFDFRDINADRQMLQNVCDRLGVDVFTSTYYTTPITTPSVFVLHDMIPEVFGCDLSEPAWQMKHAGIRHARAIHSVSNSSKQDLLKYFPEIPADNIVVTHNGVRPVFRRRTQEEISVFTRTLGMTKPYFLIVGARGGHKNTRLIFEALRLLKNVEYFDLVLTGGSPLEPEFAAMMPAGCVPHVVNLSDDELCLAYAGAVALLHPSRYEGFGLPLVEAMASGCPVITCANSSLTEIGGDAVYYVPPDSPQVLAGAILDLCKPEKRQILIERGLARARKFSLPEAAAKLKRMLLSVAEQAKAHHQVK